VKAWVKSKQIISLPRKIRVKVKGGQLESWKGREVGMVNKKE
jgi:hypothetical protein